MQAFPMGNEPETKNELTLDEQEKRVPFDLASRFREIMVSIHVFICCQLLRVQRTNKMVCHLCV